MIKCFTIFPPFLKSETWFKFILPINKKVLFINTVYVFKESTLTFINNENYSIKVCSFNFFITIANCKSICENG